MSTQDESFLQALREAFKVEAEEHLQAISSGLLQIEKTPGADQQAPVLESVYREAHSLKGAARAVNRTDVETVCQSLENVFAGWKRREMNPSAEAFDLLHRAVNTAGQLIASAGTENNADAAAMAGMLQQIAKAGAPVPKAPPEPEALPADPATIPGKTSGAETVRVATAKLDRLILQTEEMLSVKMTAGQRVADLNDTRILVEQWKSEWAKVYSEMQTARHAITKSIASPSLENVRLVEFLDWNHAHMKTLEGRLDALARTAVQDHHTIGLRVDELVEDSKRLLMLPFSTLLAILPKTVRELSREQGKEIELVLRGGDVEIDKRILEEMKDPLLHLVRNCIDHGIEKPEWRTRANKPAAGTITVAISQIEGSKVEILVTDDGEGIDLARLKESAIKHGVITAREAQKLGEHDTLNLMFESGVSTSPIITEISGRGLGMAIVREKSEKLGGHIVIETQKGRGSSFRIHLPVTLATFRGILVHAADQTFVIPTASVERVGRVHRNDIKTVENRETIALDERAISFVRLASVLELKGRPSEPELISYLILAAADKRIAFAVDELLHEEEVLVKRLAAPLARVRNIAGVTVLGSGQAIPILNIADLMRSALGARLPVPEAGPEPGIPKHKASVLVVEDSITARMLLKSIIEAAGYAVKIAVDGVDALTTLRSADFDLVVTDVEMPRMNGFDLTARIRADKKLAETPVILVTALSTPADREHGIDVGANAYIVKSSFDQSNLLEAIRRLV